MPACSPQLTLLLTAEALTPSYCQPHLNYERLETLGDAYLKYDCCLHVYCAYSKAHEGQWHDNCRWCLLSSVSILFASQELQHCVP